MTDPDPILQVLEYVRKQHREIEDAAFLPRPGRWRVYRDRTSHGWVAEPPSDSWRALIWALPRTFLVWEHAYAFADAHARLRQGDFTLVGARHD